MEPLRFSALRQMGKSAAHYRAAIAAESATTSGMDIGSAADLMILGGQPVLAYPGAVRRGKEFEAFSAAHPNALIVTRKEYDQASGIAEAIAGCHDAVRLLTGVRQRTHYWDFQGRPCRGTPDVVGDGFLTDLKTSETSDPRYFPWKVKRYAHHAAAAWYRHGLALCDVLIAESYIVAVEQTAPYVVTVFRLTDHVLELGERLWRLWFEQLKVCEESDAFPPYTQAIVELDLPDEDEIVDLSDAVEIVAVSE